MENMLTEYVPSAPRLLNPSFSAALPRRIDHLQTIDCRVKIGLMEPRKNHSGTMLDGIRDLPVHLIQAVDRPRREPANVHLFQGTHSQGAQRRMPLWVTRLSRGAAACGDEIRT
jgi:hypothetical protein